MGRKWGKRANLAAPPTSPLDRRTVRLVRDPHSGLSGGVVGSRDATIIGVGPSTEAIDNGLCAAITIVIQAGPMIHGVRMSRTAAFDHVKDVLDTLDLPAQAVRGEQRGT